MARTAGINRRWLLSVGGFAAAGAAAWPSAAGASPPRLCRTTDMWVQLKTPARPAALNSARNGGTETYRGSGTGRLRFKPETPKAVDNGAVVGA